MRVRHVQNTSCILIPVFNEEASLGAVLVSLRGLRKQHDIVVVDDGSTDDSRRICQRYSAPVLRLPHHQGRDAAIHAGLRFIVRSGYACCILMDGDGQHDAKEIPRLLHASRFADIALGSRYMGNTRYSGSLLRRWCSYVLSLVIFLSVGRWIYDPSSGFRVIRAKALPYLARQYPYGFPEPETILLFLKNGWKIVEIPVRMHPRQGGISSVTFVRGGILMGTFLLRALRYLL